MAISSKIEEILLEITKNIGNISNSLNLGVGDIDTPGSAIFEINNLKSTAETGYPYFGIVETDPLSFIASYDYSADQYNVTISSGTFAYNGSVNQVTAQKIPLKKDFLKDYDVYLNPGDYKYGVTIGLSIEEARKTVQTFNTFVSNNVSSGSSFIYVNSTLTADNLSYPIEAHVGSVYLKFSGSASSSILYIDKNYYNGCSYGVTPSSIVSGTSVKFVYQPKLSYIAGFPISTPSTDPEAFVYYPPLPSSWLPIAKVLVENPVDPFVTGDNNDAIIRTVYDMPTSTSDNPILGDSDDVADVINYCNSTINNLNAYKNDYSINSFINAVNQYSNYLATQENLSINQYWALQPFRATQYYSKGLSWSGLERFEFPSNFAKAYYDVTGTDLQHTFGIFRGDLVTYNSGILGTANIGTNDISAVVISSSSTETYLKPGSQVYGVSAVMLVDGTHFEETVPSYVSLLSTNTTKSSYIVDISWTGANIGTPLFYNVYKRMGSAAGSIIEKRLNFANEILYPPYNTLPAVSDDYNFVLSKKTYAINLDISEDCFVGGFKLKLGYNAPGQSATGNSGLNFKVYTGDFSGPIYTQPVTENAKLKYSSIKSGTNEYSIIFPRGYNNLGNEIYWLVLEKDSDFIVGSGTTSLFIRTLNSGSGEIVSSTDTFDELTAFSNETGVVSYSALNFVDNGSLNGYAINRGIKLTGRISNTARRLSVYVPPIDTIEDNTGLFFNGSSVAIASTTDKTIKNDLVVSVTAKLGENGTEKTMTVTVPKGTDRDTRFLLGTASDLFDRVTNISVIPGNSLTRITNGPILWDIYDLVTIETQP